MPSKCSDDAGQTRRQLAKKLQLHGYSACREAFLILEDHYRSSLATNKYESMEDFLSKLHRTITLDTDDGTSVISPDLAFLVVQKLCNQHQQGKQTGGQRSTLAKGEVKSEQGESNSTQEANVEHAETIEQQPLPADRLTVQVKNVECSTEQQQQVGGDGRQIENIEFKVHYNLLFKRLISLPVFKEHFQLTNLATLTGSRQPSIRCICFGLLSKDISKIDGYLLTDSTGRVPVRITPDTSFRNRLVYLNCLVLVEGVYVNPDDVLFAANIGLPPILLDPIREKRLACQDEKMIIILREIFMDDEDICKSIELLFAGYDALADPPLLFILIGDFTRHPSRSGELRAYFKKFLRYLRTCDNLKQSHFVFVPGLNDTSQLVQLEDGEVRTNKSMPKAPFTKEQLPVSLFTLAGFNNVHLATNPAHIYVGDRQISVVCHSYLKELKKNLLHDLSDRNHELFETAQQIILSNAHLQGGISKLYSNSMNLWHKPDLLVLADTEAFGNRYDYSSGKTNDTSFLTLPSFSRQSNQFKVYYLRSGDIDDSEVSVDAMREIEEVTVEDDASS